ncbi:hypothetical protein [Mucilaginibacter sp.]|uniref:nSTAND3 domain-containing NTPase n=1 Tax=Mucilaginibacter sp. TaxID=1882438 RepID=UPI0025EB7B99|nr:hypothetical protein [Mucilaginibacter sp.]
MTIETIEMKMKSMNADAFHRLGDHFLFYDGGEDYETINPVGQAEGKQKPRGGTPDTKIKLSNGKFIFIQYTTQDNSPKKKDFYNKLVSDLEACFDPRKTKFTPKQIDRIVLCFNSNLDEATESKLAKITEAHQVPLKLVNLTTMAHAIYKSYHYLAKDYLGLEIGTFQILPLEKFVAEYEKGGIATPLSNPFFYRQEEIDNIKDLIANKMITVIKGPAGVGKSRLAVEVTRQFSKDNRDYSCFCITNKDLSVINDLRSHFSAQHNVLIFIDDANKSIRILRELFTWYAEGNVQLKVILTVREYVYKDIHSFIERYPFATLNLSNFPDQQLTKIISSQPFNITDGLFQKKIIEIAKGNARLAVMAAIASKDQPIEILDKVTAIYEEYYKRVSGDNHFLKEPEYLKVLGLLSFFRVIDRDNNVETERILNAFGINEKDFWTKIYQLEEYEIVEVFSDKSTVKFTDQILEGYLFYKVFLADQLLSYQIIINQFYPSYSHRIKFTAIEGKSTFGKSDFEYKLLPYIKEKYNKIVQEGASLFDFFQIFHAYLPDETLAYIHARINSMQDETPLVLLNKVANKNSNQKVFVFEEDKILNTYAHDSFLELTSEFLKEYTDNFEMAIELMFDYVERQQEVSEKFVEFVIGHFTFSNDDERLGFKKEHCFSLELVKRVKTNKPIFKYIFLRLTPHFLKTNFFYHINYRGAAVGKATYKLLDVVKDIRSLYWTTFNAIFQDYLLLSQYTLEYVKNGLSQNDQPMLRASDWEHMELIFGRHFDPEIFIDAYIINKIIIDLSRGNDDLEFYKRYLELANTEKYQWFKVLDFDLLRRRERDKRENESWEDFTRRYNALKTREILSVFNYSLASEYLPVFDVLGDCAIHNIWLFYRENNAAQIILNKLIESNVIFIELFTTLITKPYFYQIVHYGVFFQAIQDAGIGLLETVERIIFDKEFINCQYVRIGFFNALNEAHVTPGRCKVYKALLASLNGSFFLYFSNIHLYVQLDSDFLSDILPILLERANAKTVEFRLEEDFIEKNYILFDKMETAKNLYLYLSGRIDRYDYEGSELLFILKNEPAFLSELLQLIIIGLRLEREDHHQLTALWNLPDYLPAIGEVFDQSVVSPNYLFRGERILDDLIENRASQVGEEKKVAFFEHYIRKHATDLRKMNACFKIIQNKLHSHFDVLFKTFLLLNDDVKLFKQIRWTDQGTIIRSGDSIAGEIDERIWQNIKSLVQEMKPQSKFINHKIFINQQIDYCRKSAISERKWDFFRNR